MGQPVKNQIVGLIRFSYPSIGGFKQSQDSDEKTRAYLYDPNRLEQRFRLFERLTLPSLIKQTDQDMTVLILTGRDLPHAYSSRLNDLVAGYDWIKIIRYAPRKHYNAIKSAFAEISRDGFTHRTTFRLDDDDAVDMRFIERLRRTCDDLAGHLAVTRPTAISFQHGLYVDYRSTPPNLFSATEKTPLSVGTALLAPVDYTDNIYRRNHRILGQFFNVFSDCDPPSFIRAIHDHNDCNPGFSGRTGDLSNQDIDRVLKDHFAISRMDLLAR
ncbi:glycosyltransferase [Pseudaestuariivita rosea]|uniref:glycosyltransferase n=1 Tax=Pseudaestuariivita rosea TaxID=2763263 RepID=UPI001ABA3F68